MPLPDVIAIDGPAGSGKSTISYLLAEQLGYLFIDTGVFYRAMALVALRQQISPNAVIKLEKLAYETLIEIRPEPDDDTRQYSVWVDNEDVTDALRSGPVEALVSIIAAIPEVRGALLPTQRKVAEQGKVIMAGRDIGTVVLPNAEMKFYIDASLQERAQRRYLQKRETDQHVQMQDIEDNLRQRDKVDSERETSPLRRAEDALYILTDAKPIEVVVREVLHQIRQWESC